MIKEELIRAVAKKANVTNVVAERVLDALAGTTIENLKAGADSPLPGVGKLSVASRAARTGRNPRTGEAVQVPAANVVKFKPAMPLREAVN